MPLSPIKLKQLDTTQLAGFVSGAVQSGFVAIVPDQTISGTKTFVGIIDESNGGGIRFLEDLYLNKTGAYIKSGDLYLDIQDRFMYGDWRTNTNPSESGDLINYGWINPQITGKAPELNPQFSGSDISLGQYPRILEGVAIDSGSLQPNSFKIGREWIIGLTEIVDTTTYATGNGKGIFKDYSSFTTARFHTYPDKNGTVDLTNDLDIMVRLTGNQEVSGDKTFNSPILNTVKKSRTLVNSTTYNVLPTDYYIATIANTPETILSFPHLSGNKQEFIIKDISGLASGFNIILSGDGITFDNSPTYSLTTNYQSITLIAGNGSNYEIL